MTIIDRISRLVIANVNDLLDQAEDPEKMLNQIVREMDEQRGKARAALVDMVAQEHELTADWNQNRRLADQWESKALRAVQAERDDLAKECLLRKRNHEYLSELYAEQVGAQAHAVEQMRAQLRVLDGKARNVSAQRDILLARQRRAGAQANVARSLAGFTLPDPDADIQRMERRLRGIETKSRAVARLAGESIDGQLLELESDLELESSLAQLKAGSRNDHAKYARST